MQRIRPRTLSEWCEIFGVEIRDNDGFRWLSSTVKHFWPLTLDQFVVGIAECTIKPVDQNRYSVLEYLIGIK